ncbi:Ribose-5-phosphate isomerase A [Methylobacterium crusticola]|uniref:Ribose-5-phosphate isomerase A n=1 Tax=Methylobacterium crusticola TaxID=1697972 RepID=A0ABQ4QQP8_9HYPH|nr:Ribose-5-phosphate isomerase A [Methylobacterium crusticola]
MSTQDLKRAAAARAVALVTDGMRLGLGTGSTAAFFVELLGARVRQGLAVIGVPTSEATRAAAQAAGIPLTTLDETPELDLTVDGADEIDAGLRLVKGGGGALLREKIVAAASRRMVVIADGDKRVAVLGRFPLPIEVVPFGLGATRRAVEAALPRAGCAGALTLRQAADGSALVTDGGHLILDAHLGRIPDPDALAHALAAIPGVVEHGLFLGLATGAILASREPASFGEAASRGEAGSPGEAAPPGGGAPRLDLLGTV